MTGIDDTLAADLAALGNASVVPEDQGALVYARAFVQEVINDDAGDDPDPQWVYDRLVESLAAVEAARTAARLHSTTEPPPHENGEVCCGECGEAIAYPGCTAEETSERAWRHAYRAALTAALPFLTAAPSVTRDEVVDALVMTRLSDYAGTDMAVITQTADRLLARFTITPRAGR